MGGATVGGAITEATGVSRSKLRDMFNKVGDLGDVAQACRHKQVSLTVEASIAHYLIYIDNIAPAYYIAPDQMMTCF